VGAVRRRGKHVRVSLDQDEVRLLLELVEQVAELLGGDDPSVPEAEHEDETETEMLEHMLESSTEPVVAPDDPVLRRLLPDGYRNDDDAAGEFRRLTESSLRATKRVALQRMIDDLSKPSAEQKDGSFRFDLDEDAAAAWLPALTDLRLAFGTRIGVTEDIDAERAEVLEGSLRHAELAAYDWMSWLQDAIVRGLTGD